MTSKFLSYWLLLLFIIWLSSYILNIKTVLRYINPYYTKLLLFACGFLYIKNNIYIRKFNYDNIYLSFIILIHILPLVIYTSISKYTTKNALETLLGILLYYALVLFIYDVNVWELYTRKKDISTWVEYKDYCRLKEDKLIPYCFIFKLINNI